MWQPGHQWQGHTLLFSYLFIFAPLCVRLAQVNTGLLWPPPSDTQPHARTHPNTRHHIPVKQQAEGNPL